MNPYLKLIYNFSEKFKRLVIFWVQYYNEAEIESEIL